MSCSSHWFSPTWHAHIIPKGEFYQGHSIIIDTAQSSASKIWSSLSSILSIIIQLPWVDFQTKMVVENSSMCAVLAATPQHVVVCWCHLPAAHVLAGVFIGLHLHRYHDIVSRVALSGDFYDCVLLRRETKVVTALSEVPCDLGYPPGHWLPSSGNNVHLDAQHRVSREAHAVFLDGYCFCTHLHSARVHAVCSCWDVSKCSFHISHGVYPFWSESVQVANCSPYQVWAIRMMERREVQVG